MVHVIIQIKYIHNIMKIICIYLAIVLAISFYMWINIFKEGNQQSDLSEIQNIINGNGKTTTQFVKNGNAETDQDTNILTSTAVSPGITTIDRYNDTACGTDGVGNKEYIYCVDGQIECQDIFGEKMNILNSPAGSAYPSGNTYSGCNSYIDKVNLRDYSTKMEINIQGVYFDLSNCTAEKPWRVGGNIIQNEQGPEKGKAKKKSNTISSHKCYTLEKDAKNEWYNMIDSSLNSNAVYNLNDRVFILESFLKTQISKQILDIIDKINIGNQKSYTMINNRKYYNGTIKAITGDSYTVSIPNSATEVFNVPKLQLLKDSLYNPNTNDYYSDLKTGSKPRPVCKSGRFTSCLSSAPFTIENGIYVSTSDSILSLDASYNQYRRQSQIDLTMNIPFSAPLQNSSGIIDNGSLLESNYFKSQKGETPFIKCIADYGTNIGDPLCCNQEGNLKNTKYICPQEVPICKGYSSDDNAYGFCT